MSSLTPRKPAKQPCVLCQRIRGFLIAAAFLLVFMWSQPDWRLPVWLDLTTLVGDLFLFAFVALFCFKLWQHRRNNR